MRIRRKTDKPVAAKPRNAKRRKRGRPTKYSRELTLRICREISTSTAPLAKICKANKDFPGITTIYKWLMTRKDFVEMYERARENRCQVMADEILTIADNPQKGVIQVTKETDKGTFKETRVDDMIRHRELQVDTRKWLLAKLRPDRFGERLDISADVTFNVPAIAAGVASEVLKPGRRPQQQIPARCEPPALPEHEI